MSLLDKNIGIIGGGIGGLASAIFFAKFGSRVTIFEKASEISEVGAGIQISANGINILSKLGVYPDYLEEVCFPDSILFKDYKAGKADHRNPSITKTSTFPMCNCIALI